jgi:hypothetical protein
MGSRSRETYAITGLDRPLGLQEVEAPRISRQAAYEGGKVVSPTPWPLLPTGDTLIYVRGSVVPKPIMQSEG